MVLLIFPVVIRLGFETRILELASLMVVKNGVSKAVRKSIDLTSSVCIV